MGAEVIINRQDAKDAKRAKWRESRFRWWFIPLFACSAVTLLCASIVHYAYYGISSEIASVEFGDGYKIRIWDHIDGLYEPTFDLDHAFPAIYYEITQDANSVVPKTFLTVNFNGMPFNIQVAYAEEGNLVFVYDADEWERGLFVLFDVANPEITQSIGSASREAQRAWRDRYRSLKAANPDLPSFYFEDTA